MVSRSGAALYRNTSVTSITLDKKDEAATKYLISTKDAHSKTDSSDEYDVAFDNVVIASPWQYSGIKAGDGVLQHTIDEIPYMKLHVTLFTSPLRLHGEFFGLEPGARAPSNVYTTLAKDDEPQQGPKGAGSAGFYSISTLKTVLNRKTEQIEYVYKIFSPEAVTPEFLSKVLGSKVPDTFVSEKGSDADAFDPISWYYPHWFHSYPIELPRVTFQDPIVGRGLYYTSGIESFISCMETSALSGKNVARLIADDFAGISRGEATPLCSGKTGAQRDEKTVIKDL
jgi:prenylcysteine oxidase / farnesylcysteine lyase